MARLNEIRFRRFEAKIPAIADVSEILERFHNKFGHINGCDYLCSQADLDGAGEEALGEGAHVAHIGLIPWPYQVAAEGRVDFGKLLSEMSATEVAN